MSEQCEQSRAFPVRGYLRGGEHNGWGVQRKSCEAVLTYEYCTKMFREFGRSRETCEHCPTCHPLNISSSRCLILGMSHHTYLTQWKVSHVRPMCTFTSSTLLTSSRYTSRRNPASPTCRSDTHAFHIFADSPGSFAAHIQFPLALISSKEVSCSSRYLYTRFRYRFHYWQLLRWQEQGYFPAAHSTELRLPHSVAHRVRELHHARRIFSNTAPKRTTDTKTRDGTPYAEAAETSGNGYQFNFCIWFGLILDTFTEECSELFTLKACSIFFLPHGKQAHSMKIATSTIQIVLYATTFVSSSRQLETSNIKDDGCVLSLPPHDDEARHTRPHFTRMK